MAAEEFNKLWEFENDQEVCIKHSKEQREFLQCEDPEKPKKLNWQGTLGGETSIFKAIVNEEAGTVQFQNIATEKYLRIDTDGKGWIGNGKEDEEETQFELERYGKGSAILTTTQEYKGKKRCPGAVNDDPRPVMIYTRGELQDFSTPLKQEEEPKWIIIQRSSDCVQIRSKKDEITTNKGQAGPFARWKMISEGDNIYKFKNFKNKKFLSLNEDGNEITADGKRDDEESSFQLETIFDNLEHHVYLKGVKSGNYIGFNDDGTVSGQSEQNSQTRLAIFQINESQEMEEEEPDE